MNPDRLLQHFDQLAEAPDAVPRLRRFILDLAVRGKLVEQDPADEPASELLKRIEAERMRRAKEGAFRRREPLPSVEEEDAPFLVPKSWEWVRLGSLGHTQTGTTPPKSDSALFGTYVPFLKPNDLFRDRVDYQNEGLSGAGVKATGRLAPPGTLLMVCIGTIGKCQLIDRDCSFNQQINALTPYAHTEPKYLFLAVRAEFFQNAASRASSRTTIAILNKGKWEYLPVPLPPLAEQHRIVAKVDELMALCDELEAAQAKRERRRERLAAATLHGLNNGDTSADPGAHPTFQDSARFYFNHLPTLTTRSEHIHQLRQTILNLAGRGRLVPQDPNNEPASKLLRRIQEGQTKPAEGGDFRRQSNPPVADVGVLGGDVPRNWTVVPLIRLGMWAIGSGFPINEQGAQEGPYLFIKVSDMNLPGNEKYIRSANNYIDADAATRMRARIHPPGTIVFPKIGGAIATNKRRILVRESAIDNNCLGIKFFSLLSIEWCYLLLTTLDFTKYQAGTAVPALQQGVLGAILVWLPPLAEQHRIVAKVDELMALCDDLGARLTTTATTRCQLLEATLREAFEGQKDPQHEFQHAG